MRAARTLTLDSTVIETVPDPVCGPGEVVCRVLASATCGSDVHGWYVRRKLPAVLGHEPVGEVVEVGAGVTARRAGRRRRDPPPRRLRRVPGLRVRPRDALPAVPLDAARPRRLRRVRADRSRELVARAAAARRAGPRGRDLHGAARVRAAGAGPRGAVGRATRCWWSAPARAGCCTSRAARARGVERVLVAEPRADRRERALAWGAERARAGRRRSTSRSSPRTTRTRSRAPPAALGPGGRLCAYAPPEPGAPIAVDGAEVFLRELTVTSSWSAGAADMRAALALLQAGAVPTDELITHRFGARRDRRGARRPARRHARSRPSCCPDARRRSCTARRTCASRTCPSPEPGAGRGARARRGGDHLRHRREDVAPRPPDPAAVPGPLRPRDRRRPRGHRRARAGRRLARVRRVPAVPRRAAADLPRAALDPRRLRRGDRGARGARCTACRTGWSRPAPRWPSRSPPRCTRSSARRRARSRPTPACSAAARWARCSPRCWSPRAAPSRSPTAHAERRAQAEALGAMTAPALSDHDVVFEAVGRPDAWRAAVQACAPGGCVVFVGGCAAGTDARLPDPAAALRRARPPRRVPPLAGRGRPRAGAARRRHGRLARAGRRPDRPRRAAGRAGRSAAARRASGSSNPVRPRAHKRPYGRLCAWRAAALLRIRTDAALMCRSGASAGARGSGASRRSPRGRARAPARRAGP